MFNDYTSKGKGNGEDDLRELCDMYFDELVLGWWEDRGVKFGGDNIRWVRNWMNRYGLKRGSGRRGKVKSVVFEVPASAEERWRGWMELAIGERAMVVKKAQKRDVDRRDMRDQWAVVCKTWI